MAGYIGKNVGNERGEKTLLSTFGSKLTSMLNKKNSYLSVYFNL